MKLYVPALLAGSSLLALATTASADTADQGAVLGPIAAIGQQGGASAVRVESDVIIVTARRREEDLQDVPVVVNALTSDTIEDLNLRSFQDVTSVVPGLSLVANANGIGSSSSMRGVNHDVNVSGNNGTIQYYLNDAPIASNIILQSMFDVGQIEVMRGPQGTLRGRSTPSGSIAVTTRRPDLDEFGGNLTGSFGSEGVRNFQGAVNLPILQEHLGVRIAALSESTPGDRVHSINNATDPERTTDSIRASVWAEPLDNFRLGATYQTLDVQTIAFDQMQSFSLLDPTAVSSATAVDYGLIRREDRLSVMSHPRDVSQEFEFYTWTAELDLGGQSLIYVGRHEDSEFRPVTPADTTNFFPALAPAQVVFTQADGESHELRLQSDAPLGGFLDYVVGYFRNETSSVTELTNASILRFFGFIPPSTIFPLPVAPSINTTPIYLPTGTEIETSVFGNVTLHLGEATELSGGVRQIQFENSRAGLFINCTPALYAAGSCIAAPGTTTNDEEEETVYSASISHHLSDDLMIYASTGTSWRPPVIAIGNFTNAAYTPNEQAHITLDSETSTSYEIGFKSNWFDNTFQLNASAFHQEFDNYPFRAAGGGIPYININSGGAPERSQFNFISAVPVEVQGLEADLALRPSDNFNLAATLSYTTSEIGNALLACADALNNTTGAVGSDGIPDVTAPTLADMLAAYGTERLAVCPGGGQPANFLPEWSGSMTAEYTQPMTDGMEGYVRGLLSWRGDSETDPNNPYDDVDAYGLVNLYFGIRDQEGGWDFSVYAKNVTDETQFTSADGFALSTSTVDVRLAAPTFTTPVGTGSTTFVSRYSNLTVTPPREIGVTLRFYFGSH